jgi:hypothetical protein
MKACESERGLRAEGLVMDEAELPRLCKRPWLEAVCDLDGAMAVSVVDSTRDYCRPKGDGE